MLLQVNKGQEYSENKTTPIGLWFIQSLVIGFDLTIRIVTTYNNGEKDPECRGFFVILQS